MGFATFKLSKPDVKVPTDTRRKIYHAKVRTGCDNCKNRRIKCDERRPTCFRCTRAGLECQGYHPPKAKIFEPRRQDSNPVPESGTRLEQHLDSDHVQLSHLERQSKTPTSEDALPDHPTEQKEEVVTNPNKTSIPTPSLSTTPPTSTTDLSSISTSPRSSTRSDTESNEQSLTPPEVKQLNTEVLHDRRSAESPPSLPYSQKSIVIRDLSKDELSVYYCGQLTRSLDTWCASDVESRALQFFHERTKHVLRTFNSVASEFFDFVLPPLSFSDAVIKHQMIALGIAHGTYRKRPSQVSGYLDSVAAKHYGMALHHLGARQTTDPLIMLSSCLLFIALEMLCDRYDAAFVHIKAGLRILRQVSKGTIQGARATISRPSVKLYIEPIFAQLAAVASLSKISPLKRPPDLTWCKPSLAQNYGSIEAARGKFFEIAHWSYFRSPSSSDPTEVPLLWKAYHERLVELRLHLSKSPADERAYLQTQLMEMHFQMYRVATACQQGDDEMLWDNFIEEHRRELVVCRAVCESKSTYKFSEMSSEEDCEIFPGIYPTVLVIALNCRDQVIRREAVSLLRLHHKRCGHSDACSGVAQAELAIKLEEEGLPEVKSCNDVPKTSRIRMISENIDTPRKIHVTFSRWPYDSFEVITIPLDADLPNRTGTVKTWPLSQAFRNNTFQGLIRPPAKACICKSLGAI